jgi:GT2 family glycosyltransferase
MNKPLVTINLIVWNGEKYIRHCLDAVKAQTYENIEVNILDNNSQDKTKEIIKSEYSEFNLVEKEKNIGLGGGMEELLERTNGKYKVFLCVDVLMNPDFVEVAVDTMEKNPKVGALQAKIMRYGIEEGKVKNTPYIDTCGFKIFRDRRIINIGHGEKDTGQYDREGEVFSFEGAIPVFRMTALKDATMNNGEIWDHDYFWYGDDIDLGWRMRLLGWPSYYTYKLVAHHDRQTTKSVSKSFWSYLNLERQKVRWKIPLFKRRLDWRNLRFTLVKNDNNGSWLSILKREFLSSGYLTLFEPRVLFESFNYFRYLPKMLRKRKEILAKAVVNREEITKWFDKDVYTI